MYLKVSTQVHPASGGTYKSIVDIEVVESCMLTLVPILIE